MASEGVVETWHDFRMRSARSKQRLWDAYRFAGFRPSSTVVGVPGDRMARAITLRRRSKKLRVGHAVAFTVAGTTDTFVACATSHAETDEYFWKSKCVAFAVGAAAR